MSLRLLFGFAMASVAALAAAQAPPAGKETVNFAGGCFWCEEAAFMDLPGVISVTSGYTGGQTKNPTYEQVETGTTGHAESIQVVYDPSKIAFSKLLELFWHNVDPLDAGGQFCDRGSQYRSGIYYTTEDQHRQAEASKASLEMNPKFKGKIVTQILPASAFYRAEEYHQGFCKKQSFQYGMYRRGCGRDARLKELWGSAAGGHS
ncbi:MAG TPA: peptide-methionine (S)-S-oxide reductase MsrA [Thermoanaerobaculia bacterium]